jgi:hypothetical protein
LGAAAVGGGIVAALLFRSCVPATEPPRDCGEPVRRDGNCVIELGEHDPTRRTFDPESCGYCGDGERNIYKVDGVVVGRERAKDCPVDFHCGNGQRENGTVFGGIVPLTEGGRRTYRYGTITKTESCNPKDESFCRGEGCPSPSEAAAPAKTGTVQRPKRPRARPQGKRPRKAPRRSAVGPCPADVRAMAQAKDLRDTVRGIFRENAGSLRQKVGADSKDRVTLSTQLTIENGKVVSIRRISGKCTGECSTSTKLSKRDILGITGKLDVVGEAAPQTRSKCYISISYSPRN